MRGLIGAGKWARALELLGNLEPEAGPAGRRKQGLASLYRGVILAESGAGKETEAGEAFLEAVRQLEDGEQADLDRAGNNLGNFLLNRCQDLLYNHSFQIWPAACSSRCSPPRLLGGGRYRQTRRPRPWRKSWARRSRPPSR